MKKYEIVYQCKVWKKDECQRIETFNLFVASFEFGRLIRTPGIIYAKLFEDNKMVAHFVASCLNSVESCQLVIDY